MHDEHRIHLAQYLSIETLTSYSRTQCSSESHSWHGTGAASHRSSCCCTWHSHSHHGVHLLCHHHELELFLLHVLGHGGVLVDLVLEQRGLELILRPLVVLEHPVVSYCADQYGHNHWVLRHHLDVLFFEKVEGEVVRLGHKLDDLLLG